MSTATVRGVVRHFAQNEPPSDAVLLVRYIRSRDHEAFAELLHRHGPVVLGVCRRMLVNRHDAEDAFQAVFMVLALKADQVRPAGMVGNWLYGVAVRTANKAKLAAARRWRREMATVMAQASRDRERPESTLDHAELRAAIDKELARLPDPLRVVVVLCDLGGKSRSEAARELGCPDGTVAARLHRARKLLAERLKKRGITLLAAGLAVLTPEAGSAAVPCELKRTTLAAVESFAPGATSTTVSPTVQALAEGVLRTMGSKTLKMAIAFVAIAGIMTGVSAFWNGPTMEPRMEAAEVIAEEPAPSGVVPQPSHGGKVYSVAYTPDGKQFLSVGGGKVSVWDSETRKKLFAVNAEFAGFSGDGKNLFVLTSDKYQTLDSTSGKLLREELRDPPRRDSGLPALGTTAAFAPDGILRVEFDGIRHHLRPQPPLPNARDPGLADQNAVNPAGSTMILEYGVGAAFSPSGRQFAGIHSATTGHVKTACLTIWQPQRGHSIGTVFRKSQPVHSFAWSPDGKQIAVGFGDGVRIYDPFNLEELRILDKPGQWGDAKPFTTAIAWSADGKMIAAAVVHDVLKAMEKDDGRVFNELVKRTIAVRLLDAETGKEIRRIEGFADNLPVISLAFRKDGKELIAGAGYFPNETPELKMPQPARDAGGLRVISLELAPKAEPPGDGQWREKAVLTDNQDSIISVAFAPDGKTFAAGGNRRGHVSVWDATTHKKLWWFSHNDVRPDPAAVAYSPDSKILGTTIKGGIQLMDTDSWKSRGMLNDHGSTPTAIAFGQSREVKGGTFNRVAFTDGRAAWAITWPNGGLPGTDKFGPPYGDEIDKPLPTAIAYSNDGKRLVFIPNHRADGKWIAQIWGGGSAEPTQVLKHDEPVTAVAWSKDGKLIATGGSDGDVILWNAATGKEVRRVKIEGRMWASTIHALAFAPDGKTVAAALTLVDGKEAQRVALIETATGNRVQDLKYFHDAPPIAVAFSPDSRTLLVGCGFRGTDPRKMPLADPKKLGEVRVFTLDPIPPKVEPAKPANAWIQQIVYSPDGKRFATSPGVTVRDPAGKILYTVPGEAAGFSEDSKRLFVMGEKSITIHDAESGKMLKLNENASDKEEFSYLRPKTNLGWHLVTFSPDRKRYAAHFGSSVRIYDTETGFEPIRLDKQFEPTGAVIGLSGQQLTWSADGKQLVAVGVLIGEDTRGAAGWDVQTGKRIHVFEGKFDDGAQSAAFSANGDYLAIGYKDRAEAWYIGPNEAEKNPERIYRTSLPVTAIAFSTDGKRVALGVLKPILNGAIGKPLILKYKSEVHLLDFKTGEELKRFEEFNNASAVTIPVTALAFRPDGKSLVAGTGVQFSPTPAKLPQAGEVKVWRLDAKNE